MTAVHHFDSELWNVEELIRKAKRIGQTDDGRPAPYVLAHLAGVADPDFRGSPGALFLCGVFDSWVEAIAYDAPYGLHEFFEGLDRDAITRDVSEGRSESIYTVEAWRVFTDLALWTIQEEEPCIVDGMPLREVAGALVEMTARRLVEALFSSLDRIGAK